MAGYKHGFAVAAATATTLRGLPEDNDCKRSAVPL
jgi:hypothetical protein